MLKYRDMTLDEWVGRLPDDHLAAKELRSLRAAAVESERDTEMLNWLDAQRQDMVAHGRHGDPELIGHEWGVYGQCYTVRQAIAASMGPQEKAQQPAGGAA